MKKKIAIFCGGPSSEHEVSLNSAKTIFKFLDKKKYEIVVCYISKDLNAKIIKDEGVDFGKVKSQTPLVKLLKKLKKENYFAFLAGIHGEFGEDGKLQTLLELGEIKYSGSKSEASALVTDKMRSMLIADSLGLCIPTSLLLNIPSDLRQSVKMKYPAILKPNNLGSSVGLSVVHTNNELIKHAKDLAIKLNVKQILVQEYIHGIELSCGVLQDKKGEFILLPPIEIHPEKSELFDYDSKYMVGGSREITPPISISSELSNQVSEISAKIHIALGCKTYSRSDFIIKDGNIYYLETNTLPGMTATSLLPQEAAAAGITYSKLLDFLIENSYE